jgi:hypothetical protein
MVVAIAWGLCGCGRGTTEADRPGTLPSPNPALQALDLSEPLHPTTGDGPIEIRAAQNESANFSLQITNVFAAESPRLRIGLFRKSDGAILAPDDVTAYQVLSMPVVLDPVSVRRTGWNSATRHVPSALLPVAISRGTIDLGSLRNPTRPTDPSAHPNGAAVSLWMEIHVRSDASPGDYVALCNLRDRAGRATGPTLPLKLTVYDFALPPERHLQIVGVLDWDRLAALYPKEFSGVLTPNVINRGDPHYRKTVALLDRVEQLGREHHVAFYVPGLRPTVKWPAGEPPQLDWTEFDSLVGPWLKGDAFPDHSPIPYWPLPAAEHLRQYDSGSRISYWTQVAAHFDQNGWLSRSPIDLNATTVGSNAPKDLAAEASRLLAANSAVRVTVPLDDRQLTAEAAGMPPSDRGRVIVAADGFVSTRQSSIPLNGVESDEHWLRVDSQSNSAMADEPDSCALAWLAFLRSAALIVADGPLPGVDSGDDASSAIASPWFYPGSWFGMKEPVATVQLKWCRRAQQDYEYLWLARQRGDGDGALHVARLILKPVELADGQTIDPSYSLIGGSANPNAWRAARQLLAETILLHAPGKPIDAKDRRALEIRAMQWAQPEERPLVLARTSQWTVGVARKDRLGTRQNNWLDLRLGLEIYNAAEPHAEPNELAWGALPRDSGWEASREPTTRPALPAGEIQPASLSASVNLDKLSSAGGKPLEVQFVNGFTKVHTSTQIRLPVAISEKKDEPMKLDGQLDEWTSADAIQDGPLVLMSSRPGLQSQQLQPAAGTARLYSGWSDEHFYLAFALENLSPPETSAHNDVYYQARRAWGEDLCEVIIQPVYADGTLGRVLYVVCKPTGAIWVQRKGDSDWQLDSGTAVRFGTVASADRHWNGELAIPWSLLTRGKKAFPTLLRFNFSLHRQQTCESSSWCGPVDFGADEKLMGVLYLKAPKAAGIAEFSPGLRRDAEP